MESDNLTDDLRARGLNGREQAREDLRRGREPRRTDQEGPAVVLRRVPDLGHGQAVCRRLLESDAGSVADAGGLADRGWCHGRRGWIGRSTCTAARWESVRLGERPPHLAGRRQTQDRFLHRPSDRAATAARAPRRTRSKPGRLVQVRTESASSRPRTTAPVTERLLLEAGYGASDLAVEPKLAAGRDATRSSASPTSGLGINYGSATTYRGLSERHQPDHTALRGDLRDRRAHLQDRRPDRAAGDRSVHLREREHELHVPERRADQPSHSARPRTVEQDRGHELGIFAQDQWRIRRMTLESRGAVRPLRRLRARAERTGIARFEIREQLPGALGDPTFANAWIGPRHFDKVDRHSELEGHQPAPRRGLRPVRQRSDGPQGVARALRREDERRRAAAVESRSTHRSTAAVRARWTDLNRQLRARLQSRELRGQRRVRCAQQPVLRPDQPERRFPGRTRFAGAGACATATGTSRRKSSTSCARVCR